MGHSDLHSAPVWAGQEAVLLPGAQSKASREPPQAIGVVLPELLLGTLYQRQRQRQQHSRPKALVTAPAAQLMTGFAVIVEFTGLLCCRWSTP